VSGLSVSTESAPVDRYGRAPRLRGRTTAVVLGVLVVLAGLAVAWVGYRNLGPRPIEGQTVAAHVVDDRTMSVTFSMTRRDPSRPVSCEVRVTDKHGIVVGSQTVTLAPGPADTSTTVQVHTSARPVAGELASCDRADKS
jgi:hypothetical protein